MALFKCKGSHDSVPACTIPDPETKAAKWNLFIINFIIYTSAFYYKCGGKKFYTVSDLSSKNSVKLFSHFEELNFHPEFFFLLY